VQTSAVDVENARVAEEKRIADETEAKRIEDEERIEREDYERRQQEELAEARRVEAEKERLEIERLERDKARIEAERMQNERDRIALDRVRREREEAEAERVEAERRQKEAENHKSVSSVGPSLAGSNAPAWVQEAKTILVETHNGLKQMFEDGDLEEDDYKKLRSEASRAYLAKIAAGDPLKAQAKSTADDSENRRPTKSTPVTPSTPVPNVVTIADTRYRPVKFPAEIEKLTGREPKKNGLQWWNRLAQFYEGGFYPKTDVMKAISELMIPNSDAHQWYRSLGGKRSKWNELEVEFKKEFCPDEAAMEKLISRLSQTDQECKTNFKRYTRELEASNEELGFPLTNAQLLTAAYNNMLPQYRNFVKKEKCPTMEKLREKVCPIEKRDIETKAQQHGLTRDQISSITTTEELYEALEKLELAKRTTQNQGQSYPKHNHQQPKKEMQTAPKPTPATEVSVEAASVPVTVTRETPPVAATPTIPRTNPRDVGSTMERRPCKTPGANEFGWTIENKTLPGYRDDVFCWHCDREGFIRSYCHFEVGPIVVAQRKKEHYEMRRAKAAARAAAEIAAATTAAGNANGGSS